MLTPTKVTVHIREATTTLITGVGPFWSGNPSGILTFEGENRTFAITKAIVFLEKIACPSEKFEWALVCWGMCQWLRHKADPKDLFKSQFSYSSGKLWMINLSIEEIPCTIIPTPNLQPAPLPPTNTKSFVQFIQHAWKKLFNN